MISLILFLVGIFMFLTTIWTATGAAVSRGVPPSVGSLGGIILLLSSAILFILGESLDEKVEWERRWRKYPPLAKSVIEDIEQEYLSASESSHKRTPLQEIIERAVRRGRLIEEEVANKKRTYLAQFREGHAAQGGRVIDVGSHIGTQGQHQGKLVHFGQPANGRYLWIVDDEGNFIIANRQAFHHEMPQMDKGRIDYFHRLHKLPHATAARGREVYGSGEVLIEGGLIKEYNTASGHYVDIEDIKGFNDQSKEVFTYFSSKVGWNEVRGGAKYRLKEFR